MGSGSSRRRGPLVGPAEAAGISESRHGTQPPLHRLLAEALRDVPGCALPSETPPAGGQLCWGKARPVRPASPMRFPGALEGTSWGWMPAPGLLVTFSNHAGRLEDQRSNISQQKAKTPAGKGRWDFARRLASKKSSCAHYKTSARNKSERNSGKKKQQAAPTGCWS